jgi:hypothetical protein
MATFTNQSDFTLQVGEEKFGVAAAIFSKWAIMPWLAGRGTSIKILQEFRKYIQI